jgi:hypothetical protein
MDGYTCVERSVTQGAARFLTIGRSGSGSPQSSSINSVRPASFKMVRSVSNAQHSVVGHAYTSMRRLATQHTAWLPHCRCTTNLAFWNAWMSSRPDNPSVTLSFGCGYFNVLTTRFDGDGFASGLHIFQVGCDGFADVAQCFLASVALRHTAGQGGNRGNVAAILFKRFRCDFAPDTSGSRRRGGKRQAQQSLLLELVGFRGACRGTCAGGALHRPHA